MGPAPAGEVGSALVQSSCTGGEAQAQTSPVGQPDPLHFPGGGITCMGPQSQAGQTGVVLPGRTSVQKPLWKIGAPGWLSGYSVQLLILRL